MGIMNLFKTTSQQAEQAVDAVKSIKIVKTQNLNWVLSSEYDKNLGDRTELFFFAFNYNSALCSN